jgi:uncharacterized membrane protein
MGIILHAPIAERLHARLAPARTDSPPHGIPRARRLPAIDAARGAAMVLVCLSHFASKYIAPAGGNAPGTWLPFLGHVATPMFFIISGAMVGYLFATRPDAFDRVRATLARRAIFFLTAGHLLILGAHIRTLADITGSARMLYVTDTIALALLVTPRLLHIRARTRLIGAVAVYIASCALVYLWEPHGFALRIAMETLFGNDGAVFWAYSVPIVPWLAVHAAGTVLGSRLARAAHRGPRIEGQLAAVGCAVIAGGAAVRVLCNFLLTHTLAPAGRAATVARQLASPWQRVPPSPVHLMLFSGLALLAIAAVFTVERLGIFAKLLAWLSVLGKTSAFVFILQFYVFYVIVPAWIPISLLFAPVVFLGAMLAIGEAARVWLEQRARFTWRSWFISATATRSLT